MEEVINELTTSVHINVIGKVIDIIFLYAGGATTELNICNHLIASGFIIENVYLHDIVYDDDVLTNGIIENFRNRSLPSIEFLYFSQTCDGIENMKINRQIAKRRSKRNTICIACNPQIMGHGNNATIDINNFIPDYFTKYTNIFTIVANSVFHLYTKDEHTMCVNANVGIPFVNTHCFFEKMNELQPQPNAVGIRKRRKSRKHTKKRRLRTIRK
jgi:hypothetical protein